MDKEFKLGNTTLKVYDAVIMLLIFFIVTFGGLIFTAAGVDVSGSIMAPLIIISELLYISGVVNKRKPKI